MGLTLQNIVPWGRSYEEYVSMFKLTEADLHRRILGCADGPAAFNAELTRRGGNVVSIDPLYRFTGAQIRDRITATYDTILAQVRKYQSDYVWKAIASVEDLGCTRWTAMTTFLEDFAVGQQENRYVVGELPTLPCDRHQFDLALSSHFLFLYSAHLSAEFHFLSCKEMLRVAPEVRVFPLVALDGSPSPHLASTTEQLTNEGFHVQVSTVAYEFQRGGNQMLTMRCP